MSSWIGYSRLYLGWQFFIDMDVKIESDVKHVPYGQERVYNKLSDLNNLESLKGRIEQAKENSGGKLESLTFDRDSIAITAQGLTVTLSIVEREPMKYIRFEGKNSPVPVNVQIDILPESDEETKLKVTIRAEMNMFLKAMASKPLQKGVEMLADALATLPY